jgi:predicted RNA binding protein YcfA (HicA-like mRNA interferase family)
MPKLFSSKKIIKTLEKFGFVFVSQKGSHLKYRKYGMITLTVILPADKKEIPYGTFKSILRQSQLTEEDFE